MDLTLPQLLFSCCFSQQRIEVTVVLMIDKLTALSFTVAPLISALTIGPTQRSVRLRPGSTLPPNSYSPRAVLRPGPPT